MTVIIESARQRLMALLLLHRLWLWRSDATNDLAGRQRTAPRFVPWSVVQHDLHLSDEDMRIAVRDAEWLGHVHATSHGMLCLTDHGTEWAQSHGCLALLEGN